jgi:hypothetical protein
MVIFFIILLVIILALIPLMVAGVFKANKNKLKELEDIIDTLEKRGEKYFRTDKAVFDAWTLASEIKATKDIRRSAFADVYVRKIESLVTEIQKERRKESLEVRGVWKDENGHPDSKV